MSRSQLGSSSRGSSNGGATATRANNKSSVGDAVKEVAERTSSIAKLELELARLELKGKAKPLGMGIGLAIAAAIFALFMIGFLYSTIAAAIALALPTWAALLIVTGVLLLQVVALGLFAKNRFEKGSPPVPERAIQEAKLTTEALKADGS